MGREHANLCQPFAHEFHSDASTSPIAINVPSRLSDKHVASLERVLVRQLLGESGRVSGNMLALALPFFKGEICRLLLGVLGGDVTGL